MTARILLAASPIALLALAACGDGDDGPPVSDDSPTLPPPPETAHAIVRPFAGEDATSRRLDVSVAVADSGGGVDHVELWSRPDGGDWALAATVADTLPVRVTVPFTGPFGRWEFAAVAVPTGGEAVDTLGAPEAAVRVPEPITITDGPGEVWEITHAVLRYGLSLPGWEHGLGRHTIRPIIDPPLSCPGDPDYLDPDNLSVVLGLDIGGEARAYKLGDLVDTEVVDDAVGGAHVAVTY